MLSLCKRNQWSASKNTNVQDDKYYIIPEIDQLTK